MQLRRMLLTLFLAGLCCVSLAACTPDNTPSEPESSSSGDTLTTTLLPGGWDAADFTVLLLDKYGPMDGASPVTLTDEEQKELFSLLSSSDWEVIDPDTLPPHDPSFFVYLQAADGRTLGVGALINSDQSMLMLQDEETYLLYAGSPEAVEQAQALRETVTARRDSLLPSGEAEILYPDLLPEALTSTGAYRTAAADPTAVIQLFRADCHRAHRCGHLLAGGGKRRYRGTDPLYLHPVLCRSGNDTVLVHPVLDRRRLQLVLLRLLGGQQLRLYGTQPV